MANKPLFFANVFYEMAKQSAIVLEGNGKFSDKPKP